MTLFLLRIFYEKISNKMFTEMLFQTSSSYSLTSLSSCGKLLNVVAQDVKKHRIIFLAKEMNAWYDIKVVAKQRLTFENWTKKTNQMCRDFIQLNEETTISYLLKRYNKSVIKMSFSKLMKIQIFHESLILAQDERWRRA